MFNHKKSYFFIAILAIIPLLFFTYQGFDKEPTSEQIGSQHNLPKKLHKAILEGLISSKIYNPSEQQTPIFTKINIGQTDAKTFKITLHENLKSNDYFLKIFDPAVEPYINDLSIELTKYADQNNFGPKFYYAPDNKRFMITEFFLGKSITIEASQTAEISKKIALILRKIHDFQSEKIKYILYLNKLTNRMNFLIGNDAKLTPLFNENYKIVSKLSSLINCSSEASLKHADFHGKNFLYDGKKIAVFDWDDAGLFNLYLDIALFFYEHDYSDEQKKHFLTDYFDRAPTAEEKAISDLSEQIIIFYKAIKNYQAFLKTKDPALKEKSLKILKIFQDNIKSPKIIKAVKILEHH